MLSKQYEDVALFLVSFWKKNRRDIRRSMRESKVSTLGEKRAEEQDVRRTEEIKVSCTRGEHALTPHSGRSGVGGSGSSGSRRKGYMCRARNIGYIVLLLAGVGGLPP